MLCAVRTCCSARQQPALCMQVTVSHLATRLHPSCSTADVKSKFWGRSIELRPEGLLRLTFSDGDVYQWNKVRLLPGPCSERPACTAGVPCVPPIKLRVRTAG